MPKEQRTFTKELKVEAVRLVQRSGKTMSQVAQDLGRADSTLSHWCKHMTQQGEQSFPGSGHQSAKARRTASPQAGARSRAPGARYTNKGIGHLLTTTVKKCECIAQHQGEYAVTIMCRVLGVS